MTAKKRHLGRSGYCEAMQYLQNEPDFTKRLVAEATRLNKKMPSQQTMDRWVGRGAKDPSKWIRPIIEQFCSEKYSHHNFFAQGCNNET